MSSSPSVPPEQPDASPSPANEQGQHQQQQQQQQQQDQSAPLAPRPSEPVSIVRQTPLGTHGVTRKSGVGMPSSLSQSFGPELDATSVSPSPIAVAAAAAAASETPFLSIAPTPPVFTSATGAAAVAESSTSSPSSTASSPVSERRFAMPEKPASKSSSGLTSAPGTWGRRSAAAINSGTGAGVGNASAMAGLAHALASSRAPQAGAPTTPILASTDPRRSPPISASAGFTASGGSPSSITSSAGGSSAAGSSSGTRRRRPSANHHGGPAGSPTVLSAIGSAAGGSGGAPGTSGSGSHRRSRSLGGALLGADALASPIGGPDGVDPNLVAAISASGQDIPGVQLLKGTSGAEHRVHPIAIGASVHGHAAHQHHHHHGDASSIGTMSSSPNAVGSPSPIALASSSSAATPQTASGSSTGAGASSSGAATGTPTVRKLNRKPSDLLNVMPDTRALANTYPSMSMPAQRSGSASSGSPAESMPSPAQAHQALAEGAGNGGAGIHLPSSSPTMHRASLAGTFGHPPAQPTPVIGGPASYSRSRVRSQTMMPRTSISAGPNDGATVLGGSGHTAADASFSPLSASMGAGGRPATQFPLADAIRLQRVPTAVRLAGDLCVPTSPSSTRRPTGPFSSATDLGQGPTSGSGPGAPNLSTPLSASLHGALPSSTSTSAGSGAPSSHGLGLGIGGAPHPGSLAQGSLPIPQTPATTRSASPAHTTDNPYAASLSSASASGRTSPVPSARSGSGGGPRDRMSGSFVAPRGFQLGSGMSDAGGYDITEPNSTSPYRSGGSISAAASRRVSGIMTGAPPSPTSSRRLEPASLRGSTSAFSPLLSLSTGHMPGGGGPAPSPVLGPNKGPFDADSAPLSALSKKDSSSGSASASGSGPSLSRSSTVSRSVSASAVNSDAESMPPPPLPTAASPASSSSKGQAGQQHSTPKTVLDSTAARAGPAPWIASSREVPAKVTRSPASSSRPSSTHGIDALFDGVGGGLFTRATTGSSSTGSAGGGGGSTYGTSYGASSVGSGFSHRNTPPLPSTPVMRPSESGATIDALSVRAAANAPSRRSSARSHSRPRSSSSQQPHLAGTDEYSRIIVQSRNAKVQRWKSSVQARQISGASGVGGHTPVRELFRGPAAPPHSPALGGERTPMQRMDSTDSAARGQGVRPQSVILPAPTPNVAAGLNAPAHSTGPGASAGLGVGLLGPPHTGSIGASGYKGTHGLERRGTIIGLVARDKGDASMPLSDSMDSMPGTASGAPHSGGAGEGDLSSYSYYGGDGARIEDSGPAMREIEWVDWLDEYRKMKEAKLRSERAEAEAETDVEGESELDLGPGHESAVDTETEAEGAAGPSKNVRREAEDSRTAQAPERSKDEAAELQDTSGDAAKQPDFSSATSNLSNSEGQLAQRTEYLPGGFRRPSASQHETSASEQRRAVSAGVGSTLSQDRYGALSPTSPLQRTSALPHESKPRMVSLSPIPARPTPSSSSTGRAGGNSTSARRRRNMLGTKIENWWNAVKTGFAPPAQSEPAAAIARPRGGAFGLVHRPSIVDEVRPTLGGAPTQQHGFLTPGTTAAFGGAGFARASPSESQRQDVAQSKTSAVGELRKQVSSRQIAIAATAPPTPAAVPASSAMPLAMNPAAANLSVADLSLTTGAPRSTATAADMQPSSSSTSGPSATSVEPESSQASSRCSEETTGRDQGRKRHPYLSLELDKNISSFGSAGFESLESSAVTAPDSSGSFTPHSPRVPSPLATSAVGTEAPSTARLPFGSSAGVGLRRDELRRGGSTPSPKSQSRPTTAEQGKSSGSSTGDAARSKQPVPATQPLPATERTREEEQSKSTAAASKEITINSIRHHIRHRLAVSKESCDKELYKVIAAVNQFVEDQVAATAHASNESVLGDSDVVEEVFGDETDTESGVGGPSTSNTIDHAGGEARLGGSIRGQSVSSAGGSVVGGMDSVFGDLDDLVDPDETPQPIETALEAPTPRRGVDVAAGASLPLHEGRSYPSSPLRGSISRSSKSGVSGGPLSRHKSLRRYNRSASTSRSTSRSHSPMRAGVSQASAPSESPRLSPVRRFRPLPAEDSPVEPYIPALQDLVSIAMDVLDTPIQTLTSRPGACSDVISHIQMIGKTWDDNPNWPGRGWYVQLLLAVAGLSRVVEWWEAEKGFWNFDDENDQADAEPLNFIMSGQGMEGAEMHDTRSSQSNGAASALNSPARNTSINGPRRPGGSSSPTPDVRDRRTVSESDSSRILAAQQADADVSSQALEPVEEVPGSPGKEAINVLMELSLDGRVVYLSPAWTTVVGTDPSELYDQPISEWLAPGDVEIFAEATRQLQLDEAHTVEVTFRLRIDPSCASSLGEHRDVEATYYQEMEGKGMLMHDRDTRQPSHVMWVFKATAAPNLEADLQGDGAVKGAKQLDDTAAARVASAAAISLEPVLCRICERDIPAWFFESHSEICNEIHRLEMEIAEINESLAELRRTIKAISSALVEEAQSGAPPPEFRGIPLTTPPPSSQPPSALEGLNKSVAPKQVNHMAVRKAHLRAIDAMLQILQAAKDISTPASKEEDAAEPIERQRLLTPTSESKMVQVHQWRPTRVDDPAIDSMLAETENAVRAKLNGVNRMRNTIVYVERVRQEWVDRVENALAIAQQGSDSEASTTSASEDEEVLEDVEEEPAIEEREDDGKEDQEEAIAQDSSQEVSMVTQTSEQEKHEDDSDVSRGPRPPSSVGNMSRTGSPLIPPANISPTCLPSPLPSTTTGPPSSTLDTSTSRPRRASHLPSLAGDTPPFTPHHAGEPQGTSTRRLSTSHRSPMVTTMPLSPRIPPAAPSSRPTASSIKDFEVIKPISKGAFGSVFLAKKKTTGDYFAIKVLKKSDMIAKNQITNVKAERMILMGQTSSPFVVKLFFTFQSKDYLYLVMEYLPGGDCASLCKNLGSLPEEWAKQYVAEVVNGLEQLHEKGVVHRDMKPDNLLIDQHGHLKLTDFGLSKIGLLGRQTRTVGSAMMGHTKSDSASSSAQASTRSDILGPPSAPLNRVSRGDTSSDFGTSPLSTTPGFRAQAFFAPAQRGRIVSSSTDVSDSSGSEGPSSLLRPIPSANLMESPGHVFGSHALPSESVSVRNQQGTRKFVGTPDYLAPESILGIGMDDMAVDWWALGVILYEFLYGIPPFHAETPDRVFDNILSRRIDWDEEVEVSPAARDLMERLMCTDPQRRLGAKGAAEVKAHPFFEGIDWDNVAAGEGPFVPHVADPESTDYFDLRGAAFQEFNDEELRMSSTREFANALQRNSRFIEPSRPPSRIRSRVERSTTTDQSVDDFGSFSFKNLPVLKQANDDVVRKMRGDHLPPMAQTLESTMAHARHRSISGKAGKSRASIHHPHPPAAPAAPTSTTPGHGPPSPSTSVSSQSSAPSRSTAPTSPSTAGPFAHNAAGPHKRRPSEYTMGVSASTSSLVGVSNAIMDRKRSLLAEGDHDGATRKSSRMRTSSLGASSDRAPVSTAQSWQEPTAVPIPPMPPVPSGGFAMESSFSGGSNPGSVAAHEHGPASDGARPSLSAVSDSVSTATTSVEPSGMCLIAEDNPIALRMLENILTKFGLRTTSVRNGAEAVRLAMGDVRYCALFIDLTLPIVSGQDAAKMIKSTRNLNSATPIVALASYDRDEPVDVSHSVFDAVIAKPLNKVDVSGVLQKLGFSNGPATSVSKERRGTFMFPPAWSQASQAANLSTPGPESSYAASEGTGVGLTGLLLDSKRPSGGDTVSGAETLGTASDWASNSGSSGTASRRASHVNASHLPTRTPVERRAP